MQKVGLIGSDNSHVERFTEILNLDDHPSYWKNSNAAVWAIWGEDEARTREAASAGQIPVIASSPQEVAEQCDLVFTISRRADVHLDHARPVIEAGKPLFVDKPFTQTPDQARELLSLVKKAGIPMTSFSTLRYGSAARIFKNGMGEAGLIKYATYLGPGTRQNPYGGIIFYGIHIVELMLHFHGPDVISIKAVENPPNGTKSNVSVTCCYSDGTLVNLAILGDTSYLFHMLGVGSEGIVEIPGTARNYASDAASKARAEGLKLGSNIASEGVPEADHYENGVQQIFAVLRREKPSLPYDHILRSIQICAAIEKSLSEASTIDPRKL